MQNNLFQIAKNIMLPKLHYGLLLNSYLSLTDDLQKIKQRNLSLESEIKKIQNQTIQIQKLNEKFQKSQKKEKQKFKINKNNHQKKQKQQVNQNISQKNKNQDKRLICPYQKCQKNYYSEVSLNLHMKMKHNAGSKKERIAFAKLILQSQQQGINPPKLTISLPPKFIQEFKKDQLKNEQLKNNQQTIKEN